MKVLEVKDRKTARRLTEKLLKKKLVVAEAQSVKELNKELAKKANVVLVVSSEAVSKALD